MGLVSLGWASGARPGTSAVSGRSAASGSANPRSSRAPKIRTVGPREA